MDLDWIKKNPINVGEIHTMIWQKNKSIYADKSTA